MSDRTGAVEVVRAYPGTLALASTILLFFGLQHALGGVADPRAELRLGALRPDLLAEAREYWRLVMPMFLHHGWAHLLLDLAVLLQVAAGVEHLWGPRRLALFTVLSAIVASLASAVLRPEGYDMALGSSGAAMGLAGVLLGTAWYGEEALREELAPFRRRLLFLVTLAMLAGLAMSVFDPIVDNWGHLGGLACGLLLAFAQPERGRTSGPFVTLGSAVAMLLVGLSLAATAAYGGRALATLEIDTARTLAVRASEMPGQMQTVYVLDELADWYEAAGARDEGLEKFGRAVEKFEDPTAMRVLTTLLLTGSEESEDRDAWADLALTRWLELAPGDPEAQNAMAWHLVTRRADRDPERAEGLSRKSLERIQDPSGAGRAVRAHCLDTLAEALYQQGRFAEALAAQRESHTLATELELDALPEITERLARIESAASRG